MSFGSTRSLSTSYSAKTAWEAVIGQLGTRRHWMGDAFTYHATLIIKEVRSCHMFFCSSLPYSVVDTLTFYCRKLMRKIGMSGAMPLLSLRPSMDLGSSCFQHLSKRNTGMDELCTTACELGRWTQQHWRRERSWPGHLRRLSIEA